MSRRNGIRSIAMAVAAAAALSLSSGAWASPTQTDKMYAASDGIRVSLVEGDALRVENLMLLTAGEGEAAQLFGALVNDTSEDASITLAVADAATTTIEVEAGGVARLEEETEVIDASPAAPGATVPVVITYQGATTHAAPVLDGTL